MKFRKKPVVIEAIQWLPPLHETPTWFLDAVAKSPNEVGMVMRMGDDLHVRTLEGLVMCRSGDWLLRGVQGELYPCRADIFAATYEPVQGEAAKK